MHQAVHELLKGILASQHYPPQSFCLQLHPPKMNSCCLHANNLATLCGLYHWLQDPVDGSPAVLVVRSNITQEKQTEQALAASQEALQRYRTLGHHCCRTSRLNCITRRCLLRSGAAQF